MNNIIRYYVILLFLFVLQFSFTQDIKVSMEINWKRSNVFIKDLCMDCKVPFLVIKFHNVSKDSIYFYHVFENTDDKYPDLLYDEKLLDSTENLTIKEILMQKKGKNNTFNIYIGNIPRTGIWGWQMKNDNLLYKNHNYDFISVDATKNINLIVNRLRFQKELSRCDSTLQLIDFCQKNKHYISDSLAYIIIFKKNSKILQDINTKIDLIKDSLRNKSYSKILNNQIQQKELIETSNNFICIKPYSYYEREFDLTPFYLLGEKYNFLYLSQKSKKDIEIFTYNSESKLNKNKVISKRYLFPEKYNGYKLYCGKIIGTQAPPVLGDMNH